MPGGCIARTLAIDPTPVARDETLDDFGNLVTRVAFAGESDRFVIDSRFEIEVLAVAASGGPGAAALAVAGRAGRPKTPSIAGRTTSTKPCAPSRRELAAECGGDALAFLDRLNQRLFVDLRHDIRDEGAARPAAATLALGHGACRDVTNLFLAACRSLGAPARFVSGYQAKADTPDGRRHLHAWPEAFVPGLGWLAYDPTHGVRVSDGHVGLCAAPEQRRDDAGRGRILWRRGGLDARLRGRDRHRNGGTSRGATAEP